MKKILVQNLNSKETRTVIHAITLSNEYEMKRASIDDLPSIPQLIEYTPVGSVEFVRKFAEVSNIELRELTTYPSSLQKFYKRPILYQTMEWIVNPKSTLNKTAFMQGTIFIKPTILKQFNGFLYNKSEPMSEYDQIQYDIAMQYKDEWVFTSPYINFVGEWRYYIHNGKIIGKGRYDDGDDNNPEPNQTIINSAIKRFGASFPYCLDFGVTNTGETSLVEFTDAWAVGLYEDALTPIQYLQFLEERWEQVIMQNKERVMQILSSTFVGKSRRYNVDC